MRIGENTAVVSGQVALDGAADRLVFTPGVPCRITRFGYIVSVTLDNTATPLILSLDTLGLNGTSRAERAVITRTAVDEVVGTHVTREIPAFTQETGLDTNVIVPGHQAIVEVKQAAVAGDGFVYIEYTPLTYRTAFQLATAHRHYPIESTG